ncbi:Chromo domain-containing protein [Pseudozyma hubeiensis]|nr:Chromo domain-containing protein [Pseudozyma hubeiensis]
MSSVAGPSTSTLNGAAPSSDDDVLMVDSNGHAIAPDSAAAGDGDDAASDEPEDEYEIECIVSHSQETTAGQLSYFVKWKGYPDSENSWVYETDMGGAQEMIQEYWAKFPGKKVKRMGTKGKKGGGKRQSSVSLSSPAAKTGSAALSNGVGKSYSRRESTLTLGETSRTTKRKNPELAASRSPTPDDALIDTENDPALLRIRSDPTLSDEQRTLLEAQHLHAIQLDRLRKRYARIPDWDPIVKRVEAVEKMSDSKLRVFVHFESGDRLAFDSVVAHHRCPLKLLQFYEENLRFKVRDEEEAVAERGPLRGEEEMRELQEFNAAQEEQVEQDGDANGVETQEEHVANGVVGESTVENEQQGVDAAPVEPLGAETVATTTTVVDENGVVAEQTEVVQS